MVKERNKGKVEDLNENLQKRFEVVEKGKKEAYSRKAEKLDQIFDRRKTKEELKDKVLTDKVIEHEMLKEIHSLR